jgi:hypothetical protein
LSSGLTSSVVLSLFLLVTSVVFLFLVDSWTDQSLNTALAMNRHLARVESAIAFRSTAQDQPAVCDTYTAQVENTGEVTVTDFSEADVLVEYTDAGSSEVATRLAYTDDWSVTGVAPDTRDPNSWNSGETATISFTLSPSAKDGTSGVIILGTSLGISDSAYFTCSIS